MITFNLSNTKHMLRCKYLISCTITSLLLSIQAFAQEQYLNAKDKITKNVELFTESQNDKELLNSIITNFEKSTKVDTEDLQKTNIGICVVLSPESTTLFVTPSKYTYSNGRINLSAFRIRGTNEISDDMKDYVHNYQTDIKSLSSNPYTLKLIKTSIDTEGILSENDTEHIIKEPYSISYARGNKDWTYIISIDKNYTYQDQPRIIVYAFKKTISANKDLNLNESGNNKQSYQNKDKTDYPLYHDSRIDDLRKALNQLILHEPFKSDNKLVTYTNNLNENLDRFNIRKYTTELQYFALFDIGEDFLKANFDSYFDEGYEVRNIAHLSAHALGDIYFSQGNYKLAKEYYTQSIFVDPFQTNSGTTYSKDFNRIVFDLSKNAHKANKKDEAYAYMIAMLFESTPTATKRLNEWIITDNIDKKKFKQDLDKALESIKKEENYIYSFVFRKQMAFFLPMLPESIEALQNEIKESDFYKSLDK